MTAAEAEPERMDAEAAALDAIGACTCDKCGGDLAYAPELDALLCEQCGATRPVRAPTPEERRAALVEHDLSDALRDAALAQPLAETRVARCGSCGAEEVFAPTERARRCPFCSAPLVLEPAIARRVAPQALLPFLIDRKAAGRALAAWMKSRWFAPSGFSRLASAAHRLSGVYAPYFIFDADADATYEGARGDAYTDYVWTTVVVNGRSQRRRVAVRRIRWRRVSGRVRRRFDDVPAAATVGVKPALLAGLDRGGWDFAALEPVQTDYLAGFIAENPGVGLETGFQAARSAMDRVLEMDIRRDIGGDAQRIDRVHARFDGLRYRSVLAPVWIASYRHGAETFQALVNGRTGRVVGDRPWSAWKIALAGLGVVAVIAILYWVMAAAEG